MRGEAAPAVSRTGARLAARAVRVERRTGGHSHAWEGMLNARAAAARTSAALPSPMPPMRCCRRCRRVRRRRRGLCASAVRGGCTVPLPMLSRVLRPRQRPVAASRDDPPERPGQGWSTRDAVSACTRRPGARRSRRGAHGWCSGPRGGSQAATRSSTARAGQCGSGSVYAAHVVFHCQTGVQARGSAYGVCMRAAEAVDDAPSVVQVGGSRAPSCSKG